MIIHPIEPVFDGESKILILGSFPSVKSRQDCFYYAHPQNRFWRVLASVCNRDLPETTDEKKDFLLSEHIAVWDVIGSCEIEGSSDSTIRNVTANDIGIILNSAPINRIFVNGKTALKYYEKYTEKSIGIKAEYLPSTSPANAAFSIEKLIDAWCVIGEYIRE